ncbi:pyroglutamyl-peptidase I [Dyella thiooxydans]|uniref:Pyrrolidone-carboxylate peptidase n=1 Tax=Dyella thiooxydans TaxID=445710 RepID=A0A160MXP0_9GAMM|nr:pyroglutamyl-peptidase I [Dyella thiooxydans]AND67764.1 pyroglutamyl-peptidase I [Dyella thiooxydans]
MTRSPHILLTGFDPFGGETINPSWEAVRSLHGRRAGGHRIVAVQLPTEFAASLKALRRALREVRPAIVLGVGQAGGRSRLSIERVAINVNDARIPDNAGAQPVDEPVVADGPAAYFSSLPIKAMLAALREAGLPAEVSNTAGTYVCNHIAYAMAHYTARQRGVRTGFVHIPFLPDQAVTHAHAPSMSLEDVRRGLLVALRTAARVQTDARLAAGAIS